jgi:hypothetical protein
MKPSRKQKGPNQQTCRKCPQAERAGRNDPDKVAQIAVERGLINHGGVAPDADALSDSFLLNGAQKKAIDGYAGVTRPRVQTPVTKHT